ncbi:MAG TPA: hypothetical protein VHP35_13960, partial [Terriglobia bacterium]|nr:hypothetical protein [Terriglobia bacterium]
MNQSLLEMPLYQLIKKGDPYTYEKLRSALSESSKKNEAQEQIASKLRSILFPTILKYIPVASDRSVVRYVEVMTKELEILEAADPLLCHQFLFPQSGVFFNSTMYFTRDIQREDLDALAEVIRSAVESPQAPPDAQTADQLLNLLR